MALLARNISQLFLQDLLSESNVPETRLYVKPKRPEQTVESLRLVFQITIIKCCIDARNLSVDEEELDGPGFERRHHLKTEHGKRPYFPTE
jgi:hypothetical protein